MRKFLPGLLSTSIIFSIYVVWLKQGSTCTSCMSASTGLHLSQFTLSIFALIGAVIIAITYYLSTKVKSLIYVNLVISLVSATFACYLMAVQLRTYLCIPCFTLDVLFYLIFVLLCVYTFKELNSKEEINHV